MALGSVSRPVGRRQAGEFPGVSMPNLRDPASPAARGALAPLAQADQREVLRNDGTFVVAAQMGEWLSGQARDREGIITLAARSFRD